MAKYLKAQVVKIFKEELKEAKLGKDKPAIRFAWSLFIDSLHRDGRITDYQAKIWVCPI